MLTVNLSCLTSQDMYTTSRIFDKNLPKTLVTDACIVRPLLDESKQGEKYSYKYKTYSSDVELGYTYMQEDALTLSSK